jgi:hypothetical protein
MLLQKKKGKAIPVTGRGGPWGCETSRLQYFLDNRLTDGDKFVNLTRRLPPGRFLVLISVGGWVDPRAIVRLEGLGQLKKSNDLIGTRTHDLPLLSYVVIFLWMILLLQESMQAGVYHICLQCDYYASIVLQNSNSLYWAKLSRSQWPRGLRHELSSPARTLGSWVRIPLQIYVYFAFVLSCVQVATLRRADPPFKGSYRLVKDQGTEKAAKAQQRAVEP